MTSALLELSKDSGDEQELEQIAEACRQLDLLGRILHRRMVAAGFWKRRYALMEVIGRSGEFPPGEGRRVVLMEGVALIASELGESVEGIRKDKYDDHLPDCENVSVEFADAIIRLLELGAGLGLDLAQSLRFKAEYNRQRPQMHGKKS